MKPNSQSRLFWALAIVAGLGAFLAALQVAPAGTFPPWVTALAGAAVLGLGAFGMALRAADKKEQDPEPKPRRKRSDQGYAVIESVIVMGFWALVFLVLALALSLLSSCSATWPQQCRLQDQVQRCQCKRLVGIDHTRSKTYTWECDGAKLPIVAEYGSVKIAEPAMDVAP